MSIAEKKQKTLMRRRKTAIILSAALVLLLAIALFFVLDFARTLTFEDVDGSTYYIRKKAGIYAVYDKERAVLPFDEQYSCYVTVAGTMVKVNAETGAWEVFAVVATEGHEVVGTASRILLFPRVEKEYILSLEVHNSHGSYSFTRRNEKGEIDAGAGFVIDSAPLVDFSQEKFASLYVGAGYSLSLEKLVDPIRDANGEYTEYGLSPQTRVRDVEDVDGNGEAITVKEEYAYEPAYFILTQTDGSKHKVLIGDKLVTGKGYYAQYVELKDGEEKKLPGVYVLDVTTGTHVNYAIEEYVTPMMTYPLNMNNYYDVEDFTISHRKEGAVAGDSGAYRDMISFSFVDLSLRQGTLKDSHPYEFKMDLVGFTPTLTSIDSCLYAMYSPTFAEKGVRVLSPTNEQLAEYGLFSPVTDGNGKIVLDENGAEKYVPFSSHRISFAYDVLDDQNQYSFTVEHSIVISRPKDDTLNPRDNYFAYAAFREYVKNADGTQTHIMTYSSDMIVEVESHALEFLTWDRGDWVSTSYIVGTLAYVTDIKITSPGYNASFVVDNSASAPNEDGTFNADLLKVYGTDSLGNKRESFNCLPPIRDKNNFVWIVTATNLQVYTMTGELRSMAEGVPYYAYNKAGKQALCRNGYIECDGYKVEVTADKVRILYDDNSSEEYLRYDTDIFRSYYEMMLHATIVDSYEPESEEELKEILNNEILTMTITRKDKTGTVETHTYSFYRISARKAYITIDGNGGFYVYKNRVDKFITDAQKFFAGEIIDPTGKN